MYNKLLTIIVVLLMVGLFFFGRASVKDTTIVSTKIERDTIIVRDTIRQYYPKEVERVVVRTERVEVPIVHRDTIREVVEVKKEDIELLELIKENGFYLIIHHLLMRIKLK